MANVPGTFYTAETQRRGTTPVSPPSAVDDPQDPVNPGGPPVVPPVAERYASEAAMIADQLNQKSGYLYFDGTANWWYKGTIVGDITDYQAFGSGSGSAPVAATYANQAAMIAAQGSQVANYFYFDSVRYWEYLGTTAGTIADYRKAVFGVSPYDLAQEGAADGEVLTWVAANSRYEPVAPSGGGGSKWTDVGSGIYRNSKVLVNRTTFLDSTASFEVAGRVSQVDMGTSTHFGFEAGLSDDFTSNQGTSYGYQAATSNVTGIRYVAIGHRAGALSTGSEWVAVGHGAGDASTSGTQWVAVGYNAAGSVTTGALFVAIGSGAGAATTTGGSWVAIGRSSASSNTNGGLFVAIGNNTALSSNGSEYVAIGTEAALGLTTGDLWTSIGRNAGRYLSGTSTNATSYSNSVYIGANSKVSSNGVTNEIVIGYLAEGVSSNTVVLGNTSIVSTYLRGNLFLSDPANIVIGTTTGTKIGTATSQKLSFWNKTPIIQPTTGITGATLAAGGGTTITDTHTFGGYTLQQIAAALINTGILA